MYHNKNKEMYTKTFWEQCSLKKVQSIIIIVVGLNMYYYYCHYYNSKIFITCYKKLRKINKKKIKCKFLEDEDCLISFHVTMYR